MVTGNPTLCVEMKAPIHREGIGQDSQIGTVRTLKRLGHRAGSKNRKTKTDKDYDAELLRGIQKVARKGLKVEVIP